MKRRSQAGLFWYPFTMLVMLCLLGALCWLLHYLVQTDPLSVGPFFALLMTGLQLYLMGRMVRWGQKRVRAARRLRATPFLYRRKPGRPRAYPSSANPQRTPQNNVTA